MDFRFSEQEEAFRGEVRRFLADYAGLDGFLQQGHKWPKVRRMFERMGERGWLSLSWPQNCGGQGMSPTYEYILWDEMAYARAARNPLSAGIVAKTLIRHGTDAQKRRWLPSIRTGHTHFSLGYSEPEAGSDLASLRTRAERRGDVYRIDGQKCWQSYAQDMDYLWLLARTGSQESRGKGVSLFIVDLRAPGVTVRPLPIIDGDQLNEIFLEGVEVPAEQRIGPENGAWAIIAEALADERHIQFPPGRVRRDLEEVVEWLRAHGKVNDPIARRRIAELAVEVDEVEAHALLVLDAMLKGRSAVVAAATNKIAHTLACQNIATAALEFGAQSTLILGERPELLWRISLWETIGGGTTEVMRSVVARQGLGLGAGA
jgi:alkylation response protein AidB-like acyl-CoA dehydrogenase